MELVATIFAGVNGSGKTTLYYNELEKGHLFGYRVNIDEIVSSFGDWRSASDQTRGSKIAITMRNQYIQSKQSFNQETTLCGASILKLFTTLKNAGYKIALHYIGLDSIEMAQERVKLRVAKGGHDIAPDLIKRRFTQSLKNLLKLAPICDDILLFDNAKNLTLIAQKSNSNPMEFEAILNEFADSRMSS